MRLAPRTWGSRALGRDDIDGPNPLFLGGPWSRLATPVVLGVVVRLRPSFEVLSVKGGRRDR